MDECLNEFIDTAEYSISLLRQLVKDIEAHHTRCNVVKTAGTTATVTGSALTIGCIIAAPFTGGASIVALTGFGAATALAGATTNIGTDFIDLIWTKKYINELTQIEKRRESVSERFTVYLNQIQQEAERIFNQNGNKEDAFRDALEILISEGKLGWQGKQINDMAKNVGRTTGTSLLRNGGKVWKGMRVNSELLASALQRMGVEVSKRAAFNVVKGATVVLSAVFIIWDLKSLADSLSSDHPVVEPVENTIKQITEQLKILKDFRESLGG